MTPTMMLGIGMMIFGVAGIIFSLKWCIKRMKELDADERSYTQSVMPVLGDIECLVIPERDPADPEFDLEITEVMDIDTFNAIVAKDEEKLKNEQN